MRFSNLFAKTLREAPADAETVSHRLLVRASFIQQVAAGIFSYLPLGWRSIEKIKRIIKEEMDAAGGQEVNMPVVQPREVWERSGRADTFVPPLAQFTDRRQRQMVLAPTHEEVVTTMAKTGILSYRDLPFTLYQIQTKFRDETRPRGGLLRVREFEMKDAYSFDADEEGLDLSYESMAAAYRAIFSRCGLNAIMVDADSGPIGGKDSKEFVLPAESGEDVILVCDGCEYAANGEKAEFRKTAYPPEEQRAIEEFETPGVKTIEDLAEFEGVPRSRTAKAVFYMADGEMALITIRGDYEVNETKLRNALGGADVRMATPPEVEAAGLVAGSASAVGVGGVKSVVDDSIAMGANYLAGANKDGYHLRNVNFPRDFAADLNVDIAEAQDGSACAKCDGVLRARRGIEVGHIFKLGTVYSQKLGADFLDERGDHRDTLMGCYGIGVGRLLAAAVEANHDDRGMVLPRAIAPYEVYLAGINREDDEVTAKADDLYESLVKRGVEVLYDDRDEPPGVKFNDADLIGPPLRAVVSRRSSKAGGTEIKMRAGKSTEVVPFDSAPDDILRALRGA